MCIRMCVCMCVMHEGMCDYENSGLSALSKTKEKKENGGERRIKIFCWC